MGAAYSFASTWHIDAPVDACAAAFAEMFTSRDGRATDSWWRGVRVERAPRRIGVGERVVLGVRSPFGYRLRVDLTVTAWRQDREIAATSAGDLTGRGRITLRARSEHASSVTIVWNVKTERAWMSKTSFLLRPAFTVAHAWVMRAGERGLREAAADAPSDIRNADNRRIRQGPRRACR
ncbi:hypothetical protein ACFQZV_10210 [Microbacterium koreense]|uniref:DUF1990 domain-containing protein n=1 Tax=Microbacterium koreense TaxID=323761 RepID=A0ABW2ZT88_9MICO